MSFKITSIHAFISVDKDGEEGLCGMLMPNGQWMPFICADEQRVNIVRPLAERIYRETGIPIKLIKFSVREDIEDIG